MRHKSLFACVIVMFSLSLAASALAEPAVQVFANKLEFDIGDNMEVWVSAQNPDEEIWVDFYLFVRLPDGNLYFWPTFSRTPEPYNVVLPGGFQMLPMKLFEIVLPDNAMIGTFTWYAALTLPGDNVIIGDLSEISVTVNSSTETLRAFASATPMRGLAPLEVLFEGVATGGRPPYQLFWDFESDGQYDAESPDSIHTYSESGMFEAVLFVRDANLDVAEDYLTINVAPELTVVAEATPQSGDIPLEVSFMATAEGGYGPYTYLWDFQGDGKADSSLRAPEFTFVQEGNYFCAVQATDSSGNTTIDVVVIDAYFERPPTGMVLVSGSVFSMGSTEEGDEMPEHDVWLDSYYIDRYPVTNSQYRQFTIDTLHLPPAFSEDEDFNQTDHPVVGVTFYDALTYCEWMGKCLPTEAQWEKAAKGPTHRMFPWGNTLPDAGGVFWANIHNDDAAEEDGFEFTSPVGYYDGENYGTGNAKSPYGCYDMAGNVWEWCSDWYLTDYYQYSPYRNPAGPSFGTMKAIRGGSWDSDVWDIRTSGRNWFSPLDLNQFTGFRCAQEISPVR
ncbi:SUMF1/EgtB/PvdO family nonheme iron enzyme [bacterium]|nr:SUMF1/EgtB/PvdO family nonheme iron enzyme [bacterium]